MKKAILLFSICLLLTGCGSKAPAGTTVPETAPVRTEAPTKAAEIPEVPETQTEAVPATEETEALASDAYQVVYNIMTEGGEEFAAFQGIAPDGSLVWTYDTRSYPAAQLTQITPIGRFQDTYYLVEGGTVTGLDILTGQVLFQNPDFMGSPAQEAILIDPYGFLCLAGYDGPDLYIMDSRGHTVKRISSLDENFCRPARVRLEGSRLAVYMESDCQGNSGDFPCYVEIDWWPQPQG